MPFGVTSTGFVRETEEEILARLATTARSTISPSLDVSENSVLGRLLAIFAAEKAQDQEIMEAVYNAFSDLASGQALDNRAALTGTTREPATYSTVTATVNLDASTTRLAGEIRAHVSGNANAIFVSIADVTSTTAGDYSVAMQAESTGPVVAPAGTLTELLGSPFGVNSITNALDADPGTDLETDAALRVRRRAELTAQGTGTEDSMVADVLRVDGVDAASILVNRASTPANGLPGHAFELVVFNGAADDIAQAIWDGMPSGINNAGTSSGTATDDGGNSQTVYFTRPDEIRIYVAVTVTTDPNTYAGDAEIKSAIANFTNGALEITLPSGAILDGTLGVGADVVLSKLYSAIYTVSGVVDVTDLRIDTVSPATGTANIAIGDREIVAVSSVAGIQTADVSVTSS